MKPRPLIEDRSFLPWLVKIPDAKEQSSELLRDCLLFLNQGEHPYFWIERNEKHGSILRKGA